MSSDLVLFTRESGDGTLFSSFYRYFGKQHCILYLP
jgi:hypothetical protein